MFEYFGQVDIGFGKAVIRKFGEREGFVREFEGRLGAVLNAEPIRLILLLGLLLEWVAEEPKDQRGDLR